MLSVSWSVDPVEVASYASLAWGPGFVTLATDPLGRVVRILLSARRPNRDLSEGLAAPLLEQLRAYLAGERRAFDMVCLLPRSSPFQQLVLERLLEVPYGRVVTYGELARKAGRPGAARAVGRVMGKNPCPVVLPCHRVVAAKGLGGYGPGLDWKRALLALEGVRGGGQATRSIFGANSAM